jgi:hypothetical protein
MEEVLSRGIQDSPRCTDARSNIASSTLLPKTALFRATKLPFSGPTPRYTATKLLHCYSGTLLPKTALFRATNGPSQGQTRYCLSHISTEVRPPRCPPRTPPRSDRHTRQLPVGATLSCDLQTEAPPVDSLQGKEEEGADFPRPL